MFWKHRRIGRTIDTPIKKYKTIYFIYARAPRLVAVCLSECVAGVVLADSEQVIEELVVID